MLLQRKKFYIMSEKGNPQMLSIIFSIGTIILIVLIILISIFILKFTLIRKFKFVYLREIEMAEIYGSPFSRVKEKAIEKL